MKWLSLVLLLVTADTGFAAEPFVRVAIEDQGAIVPGQQVRLDVTVFAPDFFTAPPQFPLFDLPNAVVTLPDERAQNSSETVDGTQYSAIRRVYAIVPETSGNFLLPPVAIELGYSIDGSPVKGKARLPAFGFTVAADRSPSGKTLTFAAQHLTLTQSFDRDPATLKVGDALVRTITVFAEDTQAMMIPAVDVGDAIGMKQYATTSSIDDNVSVDRRLGSRRIQTVTYTMEAAGSFAIPAVSYGWYDIDTRHQSDATLPSTQVTAVAAASPAEAIVPALRIDAERPTVWRKPAFVAIGLFLVVLASGSLARRFRHRLSGQWRRWLHAYRNSDHRSLASLRKTIMTAGPRDIEAALRQFSLAKGYPSLVGWAAEQAELRSQVESLQRLLYSNEADVAVDRAGLSRSVSKSLPDKALRPVDRSHLPALNPKG